MNGPDYFLLFIVAGFLLTVFSACMLTGMVWLFLGWWKRSRPVKVLSVLPLSVGLLLVAPVLMLVLLFIGLSFFAWAWGQ